MYVFLASFGLQVSNVDPINIIQSRENKFIGRIVLIKYWPLAFKILRLTHLHNKIHDKKQGPLSYLRR